MFISLRFLANFAWFYRVVRQKDSAVVISRHPCSVVNLGLCMIGRNSNF